MSETPYLGELRFVYHTGPDEAERKIQVYTPEGWAKSEAGENPGPIGFISLKSLAAGIGDIAIKRLAEERETRSQSIFATFVAVGPCAAHDGGLHYSEVFLGRNTVICVSGHWIREDDHEATTGWEPDPNAPVTCACGFDLSGRRPTLQAVLAP